MEHPTGSRTVKVTLNLHITSICNYHCKFCYATFHDVPGTLGLEKGRQLLSLVAAKPIVFPGYEVDKITFAGGEPTLVPHLPELVAAAKGHGFATCVVTNGTRVTDEFLDRVGPWLDWITFSLDSADEETNRRIGRGRGAHVQTIRDAVGRVRRRGDIRIRMNTVVTAANHAEDMSAPVREFAPERWKVLQATKIEGQNDGADELLAVTAAQFEAYLGRHHALRPVREPTEWILGSYLMIDPRGCMFGDATGRHVYSEPVLLIGLATAVAQAGWSPELFEARGGRWNWRSE